MGLIAAARLLYRMARIHSREAWDRERLERHQARALEELRQHAYARSPFYRELHKGKETAPLSELPIVTKHQLMEHFDTVVTDRNLTVQKLRQHIAGPDNGSLFDARYMVCATSGTSGVPGLFPYSPDEWGWVLSSYARASRWAGMHVSVLQAPRLAIVGSDKPSHQSSAVAESLADMWLPTLRLSATDTPAELADELNDFKPDILVSYAAMAGVLAREQLSGKLAIEPGIVMCVAETLTPSTRRLIKNVWGVEPFENYAATETGVMAAECSEHDGLHVFEDLTIIEVVDDDYQPVPPGASGSRILATVLSSRTLPLIRYELDDAASLAGEMCSCGLPFRRLTRIGGRVAETLRFDKPHGDTAVIHPIEFEDILGTADIHGWQIVCEAETMRALVLEPVADDMRGAIGSALRELLAAKGLAELQVSVEAVESIPRLPSGKMVVVRDAR